MTADSRFVCFPWGKALPLLARALPLLWLCLGLFGPAAPAQAGVSPGQSAPPFVLPDTQGKTHTLREFRGHPVALFFFCGCDACHAAAALWAQVQEDGVATPAGQPDETQTTVSVFAGDAPAARRFAAETALAHAVVLCDPQEQVTLRYQAPVCPRVFVIDGRGVLRYTNNEPGTDPQKTPAVVLVSRVITRLRRLTPEAPKMTARKSAGSHGTEDNNGR